MVAEVMVPMTVVVVLLVVLLFWAESAGSEAVDEASRRAEELEARWPPGTEFRYLAWPAVVRSWRAHYLDDELPYLTVDVAIGDHVQTLWFAPYEQDVVTAILEES